MHCDAKRGAHRRLSAGLLSRRRPKPAHLPQDEIVLLPMPMPARDLRACERVSAMLVRAVEAAGARRDGRRRGARCAEGSGFYTIVGILGRPVGSPY